MEDCDEGTLVISRGSRDPLHGLYVETCYSVLDHSYEWLQRRYDVDEFACQDLNKLLLEYKTYQKGVFDNGKGLMSDAYYSVVANREAVK